MIVDFTKPKRPVQRVFLHCTASDADGAPYRGAGLVATITAWHKARKPPFSTIGYHYAIDKVGFIAKGRSLEIIPAAQKGHNTGSIAICVHGLDINRFSAAQKESTIALCKAINAAYGGRVTFHGHCEVEPLKTCPVFPYKKWLGLDAYGRMKL